MERTIRSATLAIASCCSAKLEDSHGSGGGAVRVAVNEKSVQDENGMQNCPSPLISMRARPVAVYPLVSNRKRETMTVRVVQPSSVSS